MKFKDTLMYKILNIPRNEWSNYCIYALVLRLPFVIVFMITGILIALIYDLFNVLESSPLDGIDK